MPLWIGTLFWSSKRTYLIAIDADGMLILKRAADGLQHEGRGIQPLLWRRRHPKHWSR
jgi:hypothetical protein